MILLRFRIYFSLLKSLLLKFKVRFRLASEPHHPHVRVASFGPASKDVVLTHLSREGRAASDPGHGSPCRSSLE